MIKKVIWASMIDYPENISTVLFVDKCNFNCSYCYNKTLKNEKSIDFEKIILPKLLERKEFIDHVIISGGEPTTDENFGNLVSTLFNNGFVVGIHTNGSCPSVIKKYIDKIDFIGIDVKSSEKKYNDIAGVEVDFEKIKQSIKIAICSNKKIEVRTTLFPKYVEIEDCIDIARNIKKLGINEYHLQQFYAVEQLEKVEPYLYSKLNEIQKQCNKILPTKLKTK
jgi:pyruvate formate lyase activating enzyme